MRHLLLHLPALFPGLTLTSRVADDFTGPSASFESIVSSLSAYFLVESDDALLRWIRKTLRIKGLRDKMNSWRAEWQRDKQQ